MKFIVVNYNYETYILSFPASAVTLAIVLKSLLFSSTGSLLNTHAALPLMSPDLACQWSQGKLNIPKISFEL